VGGNFTTTDIDSFVIALHTSFGLVGVSDEQATIRIRQDSAIPGAAPPAHTAVTEISDSHVSSP
jgi:hypothetical protein